MASTKQNRRDHQIVNVIPTIKANSRGNDEAEQKVYMVTLALTSTQDISSMEQGLATSSDKNAGGSAVER